MVGRHYRRPRRRYSKQHIAPQEYTPNKDIVDPDDGSHRSMVAKRYWEAVKTNRVTDAKLYEYVYFKIYTAKEVSKKPDYAFWGGVLVFIIAISILSMR